MSDAVSDAVVTDGNGTGPVPRGRPAVTVGLMTHNYGRFVGRAIGSVLRQTSADWEMVVCDDASTDDTAEVVRPFLADARIRYVRHAANLGQGGNWAFALAQGTGPIVAVLHGDDEWMPTAVATAAAAFAAAPDLDLFFGACWRDAGDGRPPDLIHAGRAVDATGRQFFRRHVLRSSTLPSAAFLSRRVVAAAGPPDRSYRMVVDVEFFLRVVLAARRVRSTPDPLAVYHVHRNSTTGRSAADGTTAAEVARMGVEVPPRLLAAGVPAAGVRRFRWTVARSGFDQGVADLVQGRRDAGVGRLRAAVRLRWTVLLDPKCLLDWALAHLGRPGRRAMWRLHAGRRLPADGTAVPAPTGSAPTVPAPTGSAPP